MVEIHEPVRLLMIVESSPHVLQDILQRNDALRRLCDHQWMQLATLSPQSDEIFVYTRNGFARYEPESPQLPVVMASIDWYRHRREHLGFARIGCKANIDRPFQTHHNREERVSNAFTCNV
jgi:hypothetical protein